LVSEAAFIVGKLVRNKDDERCLEGSCNGDSVPEGRLPLSTAFSLGAARAICLLTREADCFGELSHVVGVRLVVHLDELVAKRIGDASVDRHQLVLVAEGRSVDLYHFELVHLFHLRIQLGQLGAVQRERRAGAGRCLCHEVVNLGFTSSPLNHL